MGYVGLKWPASVLALVQFAVGTAAAQEADASGGFAVADRLSAESAPVESAPVESAPVDGPTMGDRLSAYASVTLVSHYISRGVMFADELSLQPGLTVSLDMPEWDGGAITDASIFVGSWSSIKLGDIPPGSRTRFARLYETDIYAGLALQLAEKWSVSATYYRYESISGSFEGYNDLELKIGYDDSGAWEVVALDGFRLSPSLRLVQEAGRPGRNDSLYIQPSITPSFDTAIGRVPLNIAVPLAAGFSDGYYDGKDGGHETFGFVSLGLTVSGQPAPERIPGLSISGGLDWWIPNSQVDSGIDGSIVAGRAGISWSF